MMWIIIPVYLSVFSYCFPIGWDLDDIDIAKAFWAPAEKVFL